MRLAIVLATLYSLVLAVAIVFAPQLTAADDGPRGKFLEAVDSRDVDTVRAMLEKDPALAAARKDNGTTAVTAALFARKGEPTFPDPKTNTTLQAILAKSPKLDVYDTAAVGTDESLAQMLKDDPSALSRKNRFGWTLLHVAAYAGNEPTTKLLLSKGADANARAQTRFKNTPLQAALLSGQLSTAKILLEHGADVLVRQAKGFTPMHEAAEIGRQDILQLLLDHGAELNSRSDDGSTPLAEAIRSHHDGLVAYLKQKGASVEPVPLEEEPKK